MGKPVSAPVRPDMAKWSPVKAMPSSSPKEPSGVEDGLKSRVMLPSECPGVCNTCFTRTTQRTKQKGASREKDVKDNHVAQRRGVCGCWYLPFNGHNT